MCVRVRILLLVRVRARACVCVHFNLISLQHCIAFQQISSTMLNDALQEARKVEPCTLLSYYR